MTYQQAVAALRGHANLDGERSEPGLAAELWKANQRGVFPECAAHVDALIDCLAVVNVEFNGQRPSESFERRNNAVVSEVGYCVSSLLVDLLRCHRRCEKSGRFSASQMAQLRDAALQLAMAWDMLLAGDHDDLRKELALEWHATA